jgi:hypothetical protein
MGEEKLKGLPRMFEFWIEIVEWHQHWNDINMVNLQDLACFLDCGDCKEGISFKGYSKSSSISASPSLSTTVSVALLGVVFLLEARPALFGGGMCPCCFSYANNAAS